MYLKNSLIVLLTFMMLGMGLISCHSPSSDIPAYLSEYAEEYAQDPRKANLEWFESADYGLFLHYGLYSILEKGAWVQFRDTIPLSDYMQLTEKFDAKNFDAARIVEVAEQAGMKYITLTSKHHDGFCLFDTKATDYNSMNAAAGRDLVKELYDACEAKGMALFLYYSYGADWHHPYFYNPEDGWEVARPHYQQPEPSYKYEKPEDFRHYVDFVHEQLTEMLTQYPGIAGIWFDPIMGYYANPELFPVDETYALIRKLSPHALISFKQGANGQEDYSAPERAGNAKVGNQYPVAKIAFERNQGKPTEICNTMQPHGWSYMKADDGKHKSADQVVEMVQNAKDIGANLLLNIGPKPDGSLPDEDIEALTEAAPRVAKVWASQK